MRAGAFEPPIASSAPVPPTTAFALARNPSRTSPSWRDLRTSSRCTSADGVGRQARRLEGPRSVDDRSCSGRRLRGVCATKHQPQRGAAPDAELAGELEAEALI